MIKRFLLVSTLLLLPAVAPGPAATPSAGQDSTAAAPSATMLQKAKKTYGVDCAICHGDKGNGKTDLATGMALKLADWTNPASLAGKTDDDLFAIIRNGKDKMPAEAEGRAKDDEVMNIIIYIRKMSQPPTAAPAK